VEDLDFTRDIGAKENDAFVIGEVIQSLLGGDVRVHDLSKAHHISIGTVIYLDKRCKVVLE
jgi:hypothetical protein